MSDINESRKKDRSPNFPFITLEQALDRARQFYNKEKRSAAPFTVAAEHWRYSPASSGALQTAAALKSYGLMVDEGGGGSRKLKLTDLALRILLDTRPESIEREQYKREAALSPTVAAEVYEKWPNELPSESSLNHHLILERGFSPPTAMKVSKIIIQNHDLIYKLAKDNQSYSNETSKDSEFNKTPVIEAHTENESANSVSTKKAVARVERIIDPYGIDIVLQFSSEPTSDSYEFLKDYIELRLKGLKRADVAQGKAKQS